MGPLVTLQHRDKVASYRRAGDSRGRHRGARRPQAVLPAQGFFLGTTLFDHVTPAMEVYKNEIFGPVLVVLRAQTLDEAIEIVNRNPFANGTAIFTESGGAARRFRTRCSVGMVGVNVPIPVPVAFYSFGGWKSSLFGDLHVHGTESIKFYTRDQGGHYPLAAPGHARAGLEHADARMIPE
jgi:malonate-semialdehyde dehydrogenase (acetylating)/methylmalonate-semialdehyde dehydrogenase